MHNSEMKYEKPDHKPDHEHEDGKKPNETMGCLESFFGVFKNLFGCIKNAEEAYTHAPTEISQHLPQVQMPQQPPPAATTTQPQQ